MSSSALGPVMRACLAEGDEAAFTRAAVRCVRGMRASRTDAFLCLAIGTRGDERAKGEDAAAAAAAAGDESALLLFWSVHRVLYNM